MNFTSKSFLLLMSIFIGRSVYAQSPTISYTSINHLSVGAAISITPVNSGGSIPSATYGQVTTFAGSTSASPGYVNDSGTAAQFNWPQSMVKDGSGNLYVTDANNNAIRMITPAGVVSTFAGSATGTSGFSDGTGSAALLNYPDGIAIDGSGNLFVADYANNAIRKITPAGEVTTFYSTVDTFGPGGIAFDGSGNLIVAAQDLSQILKITPAGVVSTVAGSTAGYVNGTGASAQFNTCSDVKVDGSGNIYVADFLNNAIRKITPSGAVTTLAGSDVNGNTAGFADGVGTAAVFNNPTGLAIGPGGVIYVSDIYNNDIRRIMPDGTVSVIAGSAAQVPGDSDGTGTAAGFNLPVYMYIDGGTGYISELGGNRIRKIVLTGYTLTGTLPAGLTFNTATGVISGTPSATFTPKIDTVTACNGSGCSVTTFGIAVAVPVIAPNISTSTPADLTIGSAFSFSPTNTGGTVPANAYAQVNLFAGSATASSGYTNGTGASAQFNQPNASVADASGNLFVADGGNNAIRMITPTGVVTTYAGSASGMSGFADATGTSALFSNPAGITIDDFGNLFVSDYGNNAIRKITTTGLVSTFYHTTGTFGPAGLILDNSGNIIVAAKDLNQIMQISPAGVATILAGSSSGYVNGAALSASFSGPTDVKMDASGNIFVADKLNNAIRKLSSSGVVSTYAGSDINGNTGGFLDGIGTAAIFNNPASLAITSGGIIYVADLLNNGIRKIMPDGTVSLFAGSSTQSTGDVDGSGISAAFNQPRHIAVDNSGNAYVTEITGHRIRKMAVTGFSLNGVLPAGLAFDASSGAVSGTPSANFSAPVSVTAFNLAGFSFMPFVGTQLNNWKGTTTDWNTASNWSLNRVPNATDRAQIGVVAYTGTAQPLISAAPSVNPNGVIFGTFNTPILTINSGLTLTTVSTVSPGGLVVNASSTVNIIGGGKLSLTGPSIINSSAMLTAGPNLIITLAASSTITNNGNFTLASDATGCASITALPSSSSITGLVTVQRYVTGGSGYRGYRIASSPVYATTIGANKVYSVNYLLNNTPVTGSGGTSTGFSQAGNPSLYLFREDVTPCNSTFTCGNFQGVASMNNGPTYLMDPGTTGNINIPIGNGYFFFFRGDINNTLPSPYSTGSIPAPTTLSTTGTLIQGAVAVREWYQPTMSTLTYSSTMPTSSRGYTMVGNPYPSSIDLNTFSSTVSTAGIYGTNVSSTFSELVSSGTYAMYDPSIGMTTSGASRYIPSGTGFYVITTGAGATLTFNEAAKTTVQVPSGTGPFMSSKPLTQTNRQYLRLEMNKDSSLYEDIVLWFDNAAKVGFEPNSDGLYKLGYNKVSLSSLSSDNIELAINKQPLPSTERRTVRLNASATESGSYHFNLREAIGMPKVYDVWLKDALKKDSVNLRNQSTYDFDVSIADSSTFGAKRFSLIISQNNAYAYQLLDFTANRDQSTRTVQVIWKTQNEENYTHFTVERSTDGGKTFAVLGGVKAASQGDYSFLDKQPVTGSNVYRLKQEDFNNNISYSKLVTIQFSNQSAKLLASKLTIFPNPTTSAINLSIDAANTQATTYQIRVTGAAGNLVKEMTATQPSWQGNVSNLKPGTYLIRIIDKKNQTLIAENKFVKM